MEKKQPRSSVLTARYAALHGSYWFAYCGLFSFAAVFLLGKGYTASQAGILLALSTLCSCLLQPAVATMADRERPISLKGILLLLSLTVTACLLALLFLPLAPLPYAAVYLLGSLLYDLCMPLVNALCVYYNNRGIPVNFGVGRGVGSLLFASASALYGFVSDRFGADKLLYLVFAVLCVLICIILSFPRIHRQPRQGDAPGSEEQPEQSACTLLQFFSRYRIYCVSLVGVLFMGAFHAMTENYLIAILRRVGGSSGDLGIALAIATVLEIPVIVFYSRFRTLTSTARWLCIASLGFLTKAVLFLLAGSVPAILCIEALQIVSFSLYAPTSVYYARESVAACDMVKGQAMITSAYALGCSLGSFLGGRLLDASGVPAMLWCGVLFAATAVPILFVTTRKQERSIPS